MPKGAEYLYQAAINMSTHRDGETMTFREANERGLSRGIRHGKYWSQEHANGHS